MPEKPVNVLVLMCDQLRYDAISAFGHGECRTPNLDRLAAESVRFHRASASAPLCGPTRHSLATGLYPHHHGVVDNVQLPLEGMRTIAHRLGDAGFTSRCFGHMHWQRLPGTEGDTFMGHGYDYEAIHPEIPAGKQEQVDWEKAGKTQARAGGPSILDADEFYGSQVADLACRRLEEDVAADRPCFSWTSFHEPHSPFFAPPSFYERFDQSELSLPVPPPDDGAPAGPWMQEKRRPVWDRMTPWDHRTMRAGYYALVEFVDACVGRVLNTLDGLGVADRTVVLFTSDHGEQLGDHGLYFKSTFREPSVHVPFMVRHPDLAPGDRDHLVEHVDVFPTLCDLVGASVPDGLDGRSLRPALEDAAAPPVRDFAVSQLKAHAMIRDDRWKLNLDEGEATELFDLESDPEERINRIADADAADERQRLEHAFAERLPGVFDTTHEILAAGRVRKKKVKPTVGK